jgi:hypothetical protein
MDEQDQGIMTLFEAEAHSFVLRIWRENRADPTAPAEWRGWLDHVQSGARTYFRDLEEISKVISQHLEPQADVNDHLFMPIQQRKK